MQSSSPTESGLADILSAIDVQPKHPLPIVIIGAGGIVHDAHLPAYRKAGYPVAALIDTNLEKASALADTFGVPVATNSMDAALKSFGADTPYVFDLAVPAKHLLEVIPTLPDGAAVLIQKPMGETLAEAEAILQLCREKHLTAAMNFQLRWSPAMLGARAIYDAGIVGKLHDMTIEVNTHMPWELWSFLKTAPRLEILYHSIHYIDLMRAWLGNPRKVYAKTVRNPQTPDLAATKSAIILDYGDWVRAVITTSHGQNIAPGMQQSYVQWEGTEGLLKAQMGVNLDYPKGKPDYLQLATRSMPLANLPIEGNWFPDAFIGSMGSLQRFVTGETSVLPTSVEDAIDTMRTVEAAYVSSETGGGALLPKGK